MPCFNSFLRRAVWAWLPFLGILFFLFLAPPAQLAAQITDFTKPLVNGVAVASEFGQWTMPATINAAGGGTTGTIVFNSPSITLPDSSAISPLMVGEQLFIHDPDSALNETITLQSVSCQSQVATVCSATADFTHAHVSGVTVSSATDGLQEAASYLSAHAGGTVLLTNSWTANSSLLSTVAAVPMVLIHDIRNGNNVWYNDQSGHYAPIWQISSGSQEITSDGGINISSLSAESTNGIDNVDYYCASPGIYNADCFINAVTAIGGSYSVLFIPAHTFSIAMNVVIPGNIALKFANGALLQVSVPYTFQINGPVLAGNYQIFSTVPPILNGVGSMAAASPLLTLTSGSFSPADAGGPVYVAGAGNANIAVNYSDRIIGVGNASRVNYNYTVSHLPISPHSLLVAAGSCGGTDDGNGNIINIYDSSCNVTGNVNYATGAVNLIFSAPPSAGLHVRLSYSSIQYYPQVSNITNVINASSAATAFSAPRAVTSVPVFYGGSYVKLSSIAAPLNARWWGAKGTGVSDDAPPLQSALIACGQGILSLYIPPGVYSVSSPLDAGDPFQLGFYSSSGQVGGSCNLRGRNGTDGGNAQQTVLQAGPGFPPGAFVLNRENMADTRWSDFEVNASGVANGLDANWEEVNGSSPATGDALVNVAVFNASTLAFSLNNWNDALIENDDEAQSDGVAPIAYEIDAGGGVIQLHQDRAYNGELFISGQNELIDGGGFYDGISIGGQSWNYATINGAQIFVNQATGVVLNNTGQGAEGTEELQCNACLLNAGSNAANVVLAGRIGRGVQLNSSLILPSTPMTLNVFGAVSSGLYPIFTFNNTQLINGMYMNTPAVGQVVDTGNYGPNYNNSTYQFGTSGIMQITPIGNSPQAGILSIVGQPNAGGFLCLGANSCNTSTNFALAGNASQLLIGQGYGQISAESNISFLQGALLPAGQELNAAGVLDLSAATLKLPPTATNLGATLVWPTLSGDLALAGSCAANNFITEISNATLPSCAQPSASGLSNGTTGSGAVVLASSPSLTTPSLGAASAASLALNGDVPFSAAPRMLESSFFPGTLTSIWTASTWIPDKAITITRIEAQAKTAPSGCTTNAVLQLSDGTTPVTLTISGRVNDSGPLTQNYAAGSSLTVSVSTPAAGCSLSPADVNVEVQYRMQ